LKNDVNVPLKSHKQKTIEKIDYFLVESFTDERPQSGAGSRSGTTREESLSRATRKQSQAHTANVRLVRDGVVVTTTPRTSGILCLVPLFLVHKLSTWKRTIA
jgi:hypothetical protein